MFVRKECVVNYLIQGCNNAMRTGVEANAIMIFKESLKLSLVHAVTAGDVTLASSMLIFLCNSFLNTIHF